MSEPIPAPPPGKPIPSVGASLAIDYGPLIIYFLANAFAKSQPDFAFR